jgi:hypothetical protein
LLSRRPAPVLTHATAGAGAGAGAGGGVVLGVLARDWWLGREVGRRQARMMMELPTLIDLLCLAVTAGESPRAALERVVRVADGEMRREASWRSWSPRCAAASRSRPPWRSWPCACPCRRSPASWPLWSSRWSGDPLADILRAQVADVREQYKRKLIETGGEREVFMLVPASIGLFSLCCWLLRRAGLRLAAADICRSTGRSSCGSVQDPGRLTDLDQVVVGVAHVAAKLRAVVLGRGEELRSRQHWSATMRTAWLLSTADQHDPHVPPRLAGYLRGAPHPRRPARGRRGDGERVSRKHMGRLQ